MAFMARSLAILAASVWLALAAEVSATADPTPAAAPSAAAGVPQPVAVPTATPPSEADKPQPIKEVTLDPTAKPPVCRRYVPTGSRIATERCQSAETTDAARAAERDQTRRDIDEMRMRQATRDQARAATQAEALRRHAGF